MATVNYKAEVRHTALTLIKNTVGYHEAVDKAAFIAAAEVSIDKTFVVMKNYIDDLEQMHNSMALAAKLAREDLTTMSNIIFKYKED